MKAVQERVLDAVLTILLFSPLSVIYWAGTWQSLDIYLLPNNGKLSGFVSVAISLAIMGTSFFVQDVLNKNITNHRYVLYIVASRLHTYITAFAYVNNWRGMWGLLDLYTGVTFKGAIITVSAGVICLTLTRSYRNVLTPPGSWAMDVETSTQFTVLTRFRTQKGGVLYLLDVLFGITIISTLVVLVWRGTWQILQLAISPDNDIRRLVIEVITAHLLLCILFVIQYPARKLSGRLHLSSYWLQVIFEDCFVFVVCCASVMYWQGMWGFLNYMVSDFDKRWTQSVLHVLGFGGLMVLRLSTTLQFTGFLTDGEMENGLGLVVTPTYLRTNWMALNSVEDLRRTMQEVNTGTERDVSVTRDNVLPHPAEDSLENRHTAATEGIMYM